MTYLPLLVDSALMSSKGGKDNDISTHVLTEKNISHSSVMERGKPVISCIRVEMPSHRDEQKCVFKEL